MKDLSRMRYVTEHYAQMQGLRLVPLGVPFLASGAWRAGWLRGLPAADGHGAAYWFCMGLAVAVAMSFAVRAYYRRRFGLAQPLPGRNGVVTLMAFVASFMVLVAMQDELHWRVSIPALFVAVVFAYLGLVQGRLRQHYLALAGACLIFASLGILGVPLHERDVLLDFLIGGGLIAAGIGDHLVLRNTLQPPRSETYASPV